MRRAAPMALVLLAVAGNACATPAPAAVPQPGEAAAIASPTATPSHPAAAPDLSQARSAAAPSASAQATPPSDPPGAGSPATGQPAGPASEDHGTAPADTQAGPPPSAPVMPAGPLSALPLPPSTVRLAVSGVLGRIVAGLDGQDIGRVVDVLVDFSGQPRAAVIDFGGFMGLGSRKIAVEWGAFRFPTGGSDARLSIALTPEEIKNTPEYAGSGKPVAVVGPGTPEPRPGP